MIIGRIKKRFQERASEWFCAAVTLSFGATLLHPSETFTSPAYRAFEWPGEFWTGVIVADGGFTWLSGLIVNGARQKVTSTIRMVCAFMGALVFGMLGIGFLGAYFINGVLSTGVGHYLLDSVLVLYTLYHIAADKRENG